MSNLFTVTEDHLKLLRRMYVGWGDGLMGAPAIDPKRPYGNSDVWLDIADILGWKVRSDDDGDDDFSPLTLNQIRQAEKIHQETRDALQIVLRSGKFETGTWAKDWLGNWHKRP